MLPTETKSTVKRLTNYFWSAGITNPIDYIEQISYIFFLKMLEENDDTQAKVSAKAETPFKSIFEDGNKKYRWSEWHHKTGQELLKFVRVMENVESMKERQTKAKIESTFQALVQKAFKGELIA